MRNHTGIAEAFRQRVTKIARSRRGPLWLPLAVGAAACAPLSSTPPFHVAETAQVLSHGRVGLSGAVGGGKFEDIGGGLGASARARVGLADRHEVGVEATVIRRMNEDDVTPERPWQGRSNAYLGKAAWKVGLTPWLAVLVGAGGSRSATGDAVGGDVGFVTSTPHLVMERFRPYLGVRGLAAVPVGRERDEAGGVTEGLTVAGGSTWELSRAAHLLLELGYLHEWNRGYFSTEVDPDREIKSQDHLGFYLALGGGVTF